MATIIKKNPEIQQKV